MDVPATTAAVDGDCATRLRGPQPQEPFPAEPEPDRSPVIGPALDDGESDHVVIETLRHGEVRYLEHHFEETDRRRHRPSCDSPDVIFQFLPPRQARSPDHHRGADAAPFSPFAAWPGWSERAPPDSEPPRPEHEPPPLDPRALVRCAAPRRLRASGRNGTLHPRAGANDPVRRSRGWD